MPFVKLDCGILNSTLWFERTSRELFITALLMAEPHETTEPLPQIAINSLDPTGWEVPPGWYGFVPAASVGIIHRAQLQLGEDTLAALDSLGQPEASSRSKEFEGRRLVRVDGGFIVLNFIRYRDKDSTTADRSRRWRERKKQKYIEENNNGKHAVSDTPSRVIRHQAEAEAEAEADKYKEQEHRESAPTERHAVSEPEPPPKRKPEPLDEAWLHFCAEYPQNRVERGRIVQDGFIAACLEVGVDGVLANLAAHKRSAQWRKGMAPKMGNYFGDKQLWRQQLPEKEQKSAEPEFDAVKYASERIKANEKKYGKR